MLRKLRIPTSITKHWRPRIASLLLIVNVIVLLSPLLGIGAFRFYENELVRRTETALIGQTAMIREMFLREFRRIAKPTDKFEGGKRIQHQDRSGVQLGGGIDPILPKIRITSDDVLPSMQSVLGPALAPDPLVQRAARSLTPILRQTRRRTLAGYRVVDAEGIVVASSGGDMGLDLSVYPELRRALTGEHMHVLRERISDESVPTLSAVSRGKLVRVYLAFPIVYGDRVVGAVMAMRTPIDIMKAMYNYRYSAYLYVAALGVLILCLWILTRYAISKPIGKLIVQTNQIRDDDDRGLKPIAKPRSHEADLLSHELASMAKSLRDRSQYIRLFAQNMSHEFKTPISTMGGTLELLRDHRHDMDEAERSKFFGMLEVDVKRMRRLVDRLLELAKADMLTAPSDVVDPAPLLASIVRRYRNEGMQIDLETESGTLDAKIRMSPENFESVVGNILENARHHCGTEVNVKVRLRLKDDQVVVDISDDGPGVSEANRSKIFDSFFTTARSRGGTGLGLAIVRSMLEAHGGTICWKNASNKDRKDNKQPGSLFSIAVPAEVS